MSPWSFTTTPSYLKTDGKDNDGDGNIDEPDEDVYQVVVSGTYRNTTRRLAAYVGMTPVAPSFDSALSTMCWRSHWEAPIAITTKWPRG